MSDQLCAQILAGVSDGRLRPGTRLPTVRALAARTNLAVNTVARAYGELLAAGVIETRGYLGTFVACVDTSESALVEEAHIYVRLARTLGIKKAEALQYVEAAFRD
ncbi:GntR family transcriptional regulator [Mycolicibacterium agri]|uniref:GntR family transcriptional regulator n=1 Tax=Mycolicibacterium agri TaxID=36811 RepID=A0A7I9W090_MYCAG|nr:GntR family transcriptional regulator [Mycolicibacterium agri]GFG50656.1 GntR family transcriptional regulator [Mycolicibacterium agri]